MEYLYQIKLHSDDAFLRPTLAQGIIERDSKKEVLDYVAENYPEYFDGMKVCQKLSKKSDQLVYVSIHELTPYWASYWKQEVECVVCHKKVPFIELKNHLGDIRLKDFTCSATCKEKREESGESEYTEYWNGRCPYYFIYKITNKVNGMVYIGYTEREPIFRWWEHFKHSDLPIGKALKEFGIESFTFEVLEKHSKEEKTVEQMHEIETKLIAEYDSISNGYNCVVSKKMDAEMDELF